MTVASDSLDRTYAYDSVRLWSAAGLTPASPPIAIPPAELVSVSPDNRRVLTASRVDNYVSVWDVETGKRLATWEHSSSVWAIAFSPDGKSVATGEIKGPVRLWDLATSSSRQLPPHGGPVNQLAFSDDGALLASGSIESDFTAHVYHAASGRLVCVLPHNSSVSGLRFSADGREILTTSRDQWVRKWDTGTGALKASRLLGAEIWSTLFSSDGKTVVALTGFENHPQVIDGTTLAIRTPPMPVSSELVALARDKPRLITHRQEGVVRVWDLAAIRVREPSKFGDGVLFTGFKISRDGRCLAALASDRSRLGLFRLDGPGDAPVTWIAATYPEQNGPGDIKAFDFSADGATLVTVSSKPYSHGPGGMAQGQPFGRIECWDTKEGTRRVGPVDHEFEVWDVSYHPTLARFAVVGIEHGSGGQSGRGILYGADKSLVPLREFRSPEPLYKVLFNPDGRLLLAE